MYYVVALAIALISAPIHYFASAPAHAQTQATVPHSYAGLGPARAQTLRATIFRLTREYDVPEATLTRIAATLSVYLRDIPAVRISELVELSALEAETLRAELVNLRTHFEAIPRRDDREVIQNLLEQAREAFDAGRLIQADRLLGALAHVLNNDPTLSLDDLEDVIAIRARIMVLDQRVAESVRYRRQASQTIADQTRRTRFNLMSQAGLDAHYAGQRLRSLELLQLAISIYSEDVSPLAQRAQAPTDWAQTQNNLGNTLSLLGYRTGDIAQLEAAVAAYENALQVYTLGAMPADWAQTQNNLGNTLSLLGERTNDTAQLEAAVAAYENALQVYTRGAMPADWTATQKILGIALWRLGERTDDTARIEEAINVFHALVDFYDVEGDDARAELYLTASSNIESMLIRER